MDETKTFLQDLFKNKQEDHFIQIWTKSDKKTQFFQQIDDAVSFCESKREDDDLYIGVGLSPQKLPSNHRCKASEVSALPGLWLDADVEHEVHESDKDYPPDYDTAIGIIERCRLTPTYLIDSGHGLHAWWLFNKLLSCDEKREYLQRLAKGWNRTHIANAAELGYDVDTTFDLARVMRVPGTFNHGGDDPKPVKVIEYNEDARYEPKAIEKKCVLDVQTLDTSAPVEYDEDDFDFELRKDASPPWEKWERIVNNEPRVQNVYDHDLDEPFASLSEYDMSLANYTAAYGWSDQEIVDLLIAHRKKHSNDPTDWNLNHPTYFMNTLTKARQSAEEERDKLTAQKMVEEGADFPDECETEEEREQVVSKLSEMYDIPIEKIIKYPGQSPQYAIETEKGDRLLVGGVENIESQTRFRRKILDLTHQVITNENGKNYSTERWYNIVQKFFDVAQVEDMGDETTIKGRVEEWVNSYFDSIPLPTMEEVKQENVEDWYNWKKNCKEGKPFIRKDGYFLNTSSFRKYVKTNFDEKLSAQRMSTYLKMYGATRENLHFHYDGYEGTEEIYRRVWRVPYKENVLDEQTEAR